MRSLYLIAFLFVVTNLSVQDTLGTKSVVPSVEIRSLDGRRINTSALANNGDPILICFWKLCCKSQSEMLNAISEVYGDWVDETGVRIYAVSVDDSRSTNKVGPYVAGQGWEFDVLLDSNSDFRRAMNVVILPHVFLVDGDGKIVWQRTSFIQGDEDEIYEQLKKLSHSD